MASNTYSAISTLVNTVYEDALFALREKNLMLGLITVFSDQTGMAPRKFSEYGTVSMAAVGEMDDLVSQSFTPTVISTLTPGEVGGQIFLTDQRIESDPFGVRQDANLELGVAAANAMEAALVGDFTSFSGGTIGAAGTVATWGHMAAAVSRLQVQHANTPLAGVVHPYTWTALNRVVLPGLTVTNAPQFQDSYLRDYYVGTALGVNWFQSSNIAIDGSDDAVGAIFSSDALALDIRRAPRLEPERDASRRGWELNLSLVFAHGVRRANHGIKLIFDASLPTS